MPTKDEKIRALEKRVVELQDDLKHCRMAVEKIPGATQQSSQGALQTVASTLSSIAGKVVEAKKNPSETVSPTPQPSRSGPSETTQS
jgi:hypothetical protein